MFDSESKSSNDVDMKIEQIKKDTYTITITPNNDWLQHASYPVTIDPTLNSSTTSMLIYDTFISSYVPDGNFYNQSLMYIGGVQAYNTGQFNGLIYFRIHTLVSDQTITYANLSFTKNNIVSNAQKNINKNTKTF